MSKFLVFVIFKVAIILIALKYTVVGDVLSILGTFLASCLIAWTGSSIVDRIRAGIEGDVQIKGKAVLITGCDSGFGNLIATQMNRLGFYTIAMCLDENSEGAKLLKEKAKRPSLLQVLQVDVTDQSSIDKAFEKIEYSLQFNNVHLWTIINNAGIVRMAPIDWDTVEDGFESVMKVNVLGYVRIVRKFLPMLKKSKGRIINFNSLTSRFTVPPFVGYAMSRHASLAFTDGLRRELDGSGMSVVSIEPQAYKTGIESMALNLVRSAWDRTEKSVQENYGEENRKQLEEKVSKLMDQSDPNVQEVVKAVVSATKSARPKIRYSVCPPLSWLSFRIRNDYAHRVHGLRHSEAMNCYLF
ncbi:Retinol dehydrogenase 7 [Halotydeus destructor]|nr:Retinol dehydrogenase 7 [Halotydeus destructor]